MQCLLIEYRGGFIGKLFIRIVRGEGLEKSTEEILFNGGIVGIHMTNILS